MSSQAKVKHTPGPWALRLEDGIVKAVESTETSASPFRAICTFGWMVRRAIGEEESEANARLIAAAPVLLEACRTALAELSAITPGTCDVASGVEAIRAYKVLDVAVKAAEQSN